MPVAFIDRTQGYSLKRDMVLRKVTLYQTGFMVLLGWSVISLISLLGSGYLGRYLETGFIPEMIRNLGITQFDVNIRRIGSSGIDAGPVRIGLPENPALMIRSIALDYSPGGLFQKKIRQVSLNGVTIRCRITSHGISFPGIDVQDMLGQQEEKPAESPSVPMAIPVDRIAVYDGTLLFDWENYAYRIPFEIEAFPDGDNRFSATMRLFPRNQAIAVSGDIWLAGNSLQLSIVSNAVQVSRFADIIDKMPGLSLKGRLDITAHAACDLSPFAVESADADMVWHAFYADYHNVRIQSPDVAAPAGDTFRLQLRHDKGNPWQVTSSGVSVASPVPLTLSEVHADVSIKPEGLFAKGNVVIQNRISASEASSVYKIHTPLRTTATVSADYFQNGQWQVSISNRQDKNSKKVQVAIYDADITMREPVFNMTASGKGSAAEAAWDVIFPDIQVTQADTLVSIPAIKASGRGETKETLFSADIRMNLNNTRLTSGAMAFTMPEISFSGHAGRTGEKDPVFNGIFNLSNAVFTDKDIPVLVKGIQATVPLSWPGAASVKPGFFSADSIKIKNFSLGSVSSVIQQKGRGMILKGTHTSTLLPGLTVDFSGKGRMHDTGGYGGQVSWVIPGYSPESDLDLGIFAPEARGIFFTGKFEGKGEINVTSNSIDGVFEAALNDGHIMAEEPDINVEGIYGEIHFPKFPEIESAPDQKIGFVRAAFGGIVLENGRLRYKVESPESFFIEKGRFGWCNGRIETQSFRILSGIQNYDVIFYCAKLELAQVVQQITPFSAEGGGTVSGRIPLIYKNGDIAFSQGFLFSEPGVTGQIRISETEMLTEGVMAGAPKFAQIVIAREALKNYEYKWAKLELNTEKENLFVSLRFDGKPVQALPFRLDKKSGQLVRDESGRSKAVFDKGMSLDLNTSLPLNEILKYKDMLTNKLE